MGKCTHAENIVQELGSVLGISDLVANRVDHPSLRVSTYLNSCANAQILRGQETALTVVSRNTGNSCTTGDTGYWRERIPDEYETSGPDLLIIDCN
jgi:hypothetical protein